MTKQQVELAKKHVGEFMKTLKYPKTNLDFLEGHIEFLEKAGINPESIDLVISNCVINLSPNKPKVIEEIWKALKYGGEVYFSDVYCDRRLPDSVRNHELLFGECIGGALYIEDFYRISRKAGFEDIRLLSSSPVTVDDPELKSIVGDAKFFSITFRLFKLKDLESICEDYGQTAIYKGTIPEQADNYVLDDHHIFETNKIKPICGNTASILSNTWLSKYFEIRGNRNVHYGKFNCDDNDLNQKQPVVSQGLCCSSGSCG